MGEQAAAVLAAELRQRRRAKVRPRRRTWHVDETHLKARGRRCYLYWAMNNRLEQDRRAIEGRVRCMRGLKSCISVERFCRSHDDLRRPLPPRVRHNQNIPASLRRRPHLQRAATVLATLEVG